MATSKRKPRQLDATPAPRVVPPPGEPIGAFLHVLEQARKSGLAIAPFEVTAELILRPPNQARSRKLAAASAANLLAQTAAVKLIQEPESPPAPPRPLPNQIAAELDGLANKVKRIMSAAHVTAGGDIPPEVIENMIVAIRTVGAQVAELPAAESADYDEYLRQYGEYTRLREGFPARQQRELKACQEQSDEANDAYTEALIGDGVINQRVQEFFADREEWQREAFVDALTRQFLRLPEDGRCLACGHVDPKERSSALTSAIGSSTTGQSSTATSPNISEPTPTTGSGEPDLGSSSPTTSTG